MDKKSKSKSLTRILSDIENFSEENNYAIIVEGKRDKNALIKFGIKEDKIILGAYKNAGKIIGDITNYNGAIFLYDFDRTGKRKTEYLCSVIYSEGINVNKFYSSKLENAGITHIEEISSMLEEEPRHIFNTHEL